MKKTSFSKIQSAIDNRQFLHVFLIRFPIIHPANGSLMIVRLFTNKQSEVINKQTEVTELKEVPIFEYTVTALELHTVGYGSGFE